MKSLLIASLALLTALPAAAEQRSARIEVGGLFCASCPYIAARAMQEAASARVLEGAYDAETSTAVFVVSYDDAQTTPAEIAAKPDSYGYAARVLDGAEGS